MEILGHRGQLAGSAPENTCSAVAAALGAGADGVEIDVRLTADGVAVCCHDDDLLRVAGVPAPVASSSWWRLRSVALPGGERLARLEDVAALVAGRGRLVLDLKPEPRTAALAVATLAALARSGIRQRDVVASSFDPLVVDAFAARRPALPRAPICNVGCCPRAALDAARARGDAALHLPLPTVLARPDVVRDAVRSGLEVRAWTVDRPVDARLCQLLGVSAVISDAPGTLAAALRPGPLAPGPVPARRWRWSGLTVPTPRAEVVPTG